MSNLEIVLWHIPHGIDLPATPKSNCSCYLLYEQHSLARIHSFTHIHFYCWKLLLGRNNTATTSAPHERCQHLFKGALLLPYCNGLPTLLALLLITDGGPLLTSLTRQLPGKHSSYLHPSNHRVPAVFRQHLATRHSLLFFSELLPL